MHTSKEAFGEAAVFYAGAAKVRRRSAAATAAISDAAEPDDGVSERDSEPSTEEVNDGYAEL